MGPPPSIDPDRSNLKRVKSPNNTAAGSCTACFEDRWSRDVWGPSAWRIVHWLALHEPARMLPSPAAWFAALANMLPCAECQEHLRENLAYLPPPTSPGRLFAWSVRLHNRVNGQLGKPRVSLAEARQLHASSVLTKGQRRPFCASVIAALPETSPPSKLRESTRLMFAALGVQLGESCSRSAVAKAVRLIN